MPKSKYPIHKIDLPRVAKNAVARAVKRGVTNLDDLYLSAERGARNSLTRAYNATTPAVIDNRTRAGRRAVSRAANIQRVHDGMLHQHLTAAVLSRAVPVGAAEMTKGDLMIHGDTIECKRTLRERQKQIFSDSNRVKAVVVRTIDAYDGKRNNFDYLRKHGATLVMPGGHVDALSLTEFAARVLHKKVARVKAA